MAWTDGQILLAGGTVLASVVPAGAYAAWVRGQERYEREPWSQVLKAFAWGGTGGVVLALIFEILLGARPDAVARLGISSAVFASVLIAPVVEEATKAVGLRWVDDPYIEPEDGLVYGAAAGFGFAATENLAYATAAYLADGTAALVGTLVLRTLSSAFLHGTASAIVGYAIWRKKAGVGDNSGILAFYLIAVGLHAAFNLGASLNLLLTFLAMAILVIYGFGQVRKRVRELDRGGGGPAAPTDR